MGVRAIVAPVGVGLQAACASVGAEVAFALAYQRLLVSVVAWPCLAGLAARSLEAEQSETSVRNPDLPEVLPVPKPKRPAALRLPSLAVCLVAGAMLGVTVAYGADVPRLDGAHCLPSAGDTNAVFSFTIVYHGTAAPSRHDVHLDGSAFAMKNAGAAPGGGVFYVYQTRLTAGIHRYRFQFQVGEQTLYKPGPSVEACYTTPSVAKAVSFSISGRITANGTGLERVEVRLTRLGSPAVTVRTNSDGRYTATGLAPGVWTVTPTRPGYRTAPASRKATVPPITTTCDFVATRS